MFISEFTKIVSFLNRSFWTSLAFCILSRKIALWFSAFSPASFSYFTAGTSIKISILSINGPESLRRYMAICEGEQMHGFSGLFKKPQGQGFEAPTSIKRLGKVKVFFAREIVILP